MLKPTNIKEENSTLGFILNGKRKGNAKCTLPSNRRESSRESWKMKLLLEMDLLWHKPPSTTEALTLETAADTWFYFILFSECPAPNHFIFWDMSYFFVKIGLLHLLMEDVRVRSFSLSSLSHKCKIHKSTFGNFLPGTLTSYEVSQRLSDDFNSL